MPPVDQRKGEVMEHLESVSEAMKAVFWTMFYGCAILAVGAILAGMMQGLWNRCKNWKTRR